MVTAISSLAVSPLPANERRPNVVVNLAEDASEMTNLADQYPQRVERLEQFHADWLASLE